jgi:hypothetical protein
MIQWRHAHEEPTCAAQQNPHLCAMQHKPWPRDLAEAGRPQQHYQRPLRPLVLQSDSESIVDGAHWQVALVCNQASHLNGWAKEAQGLVNQVGACASAGRPGRHF